MAALSRLGRKAQALLWSTVSPLLTVAAAGLIAITLAHLPATDRPVALAGPPVDCPPIADGRCWLVGLAACAVAILAFGVGECVLTFGGSASGHGGISVT